MLSYQTTLLSPNRQENNRIQKAYPSLTRRKQPHLPRYIDEYMPHEKFAIQPKTILEASKSNIPLSAIFHAV